MGVFSDVKKCDYRFNVVGIKQRPVQVLGLDHKQNHELFTLSIDKIICRKTIRDTYKKNELYRSCCLVLDR